MKKTTKKPFPTQQELDRAKIDRLLLDNGRLQREIVDLKQERAVMHGRWLIAYTALTNAGFSQATADGNWTRPAGNDDDQDDAYPKTPDVYSFAAADLRLILETIKAVAERE